MRYLLNNDEYTKCECWDLLEVDLNDNINIYTLVNILNFVYVAEDF